MLGQSRDEKSSLHPGKALADAAARSAAKRKIGKLRSSFARTSRPTIRIKSQRLRKIARVAVCHELAHQHQRFLGTGSRQSQTHSSQAGLQPTPVDRVASIPPAPFRCISAASHLRRLAVALPAHDQSHRAAFGSTPDCVESRYQVQVNAFAVVSVRKKIVISSSRNCSSVIAPPSPSVSCASSNIESRSPRSSPLRRRSSISDR